MLIRIPPTTSSSNQLQSIPYPSSPFVTSSGELSSSGSFPKPVIVAGKGFDSAGEHMIHLNLWLFVFFWEQSLDQGP
ncbi:3594_t:CDS:2 [Paraglomus brasilianum]|uniref:3594_t:CDS:1 n=1 Tax=Paraglomus brasilianum TaxID=144538 RepID=A0A9N9F6A6_9GLOM|nr:3594_t:CDS:2 [Paraglomus brasilianum]